ncbi:unnamed protein product [Prunus armeniaca]|uniref:Uncharacterized protein n=1 Tax=Prunus armeniaca TaxID=36596 RepID=A0A6J5WWM8_PRUAR|nr:unnamed protein product [Prunus armeniaca]
MYSRAAVLFKYSNILTKYGRSAILFKYYNILEKYSQAAILLKYSNVFIQYSRRLYYLYIIFLCLDPNQPATGERQDESTPPTSEDLLTNATGKPSIKSSELASDFCPIPHLQRTFFQTGFIPQPNLLLCYVLVGLNRAVPISSNSNCAFDSLYSLTAPFYPWIFVGADGTASVDDLFSLRHKSSKTYGMKHFTSVFGLPFKQKLNGKLINLGAKRKKRQRRGTEYDTDTELAAVNFSSLHF